jgi:glycosyltransferase involved in cell wall biosynthesis
MNKLTKILFLNQMAGPLFRELAEDLSKKIPKTSTLFTGHPDTLAIGSSTKKLIISKAPVYNRRSKLLRIFSWINYTLFVFLKMFNADKNTIIFFVSNPPFLGFFVFLISFFKKTRYVVLVYDLHVDIFISCGILSKNSFVVRLWRLINRIVWNRSIAVYTIGNIMAQNLNRQFKVKNTKLTQVGVVYPWVNTKKIKPISKINNPLSGDLGQEGKITILYSGNMGISHDIDSILQASKILKNQKDISFLLIGHGEKWNDAVDFQKKNNLDNLKVLPFQSEKKLPYTMSLADIALVSLEEGVEGLMIPSKMFYYMSAGAAIIGICNGKNDVTEIIKNSNCGITVKPKNPKDLAYSIKKLSIDKKKLHYFKQNSRQSAMSNFSRKKCTNKLNQEILSLIS